MRAKGMLVLLTLLIPVMQLLSSQLQTVPSQPETSQVDFYRDIQPILTSNCVGCHRGNAAPAELHLDSPEGLIRGGTSGAVVSPGNADKSLIVIRTEDTGNNRMPPNGQLTPDQISLIKAWINQGAKAEQSIDF